VHLQRLNRFLTYPKMHVVTGLVALSTLATVGIAWSQAAPPPSLGVQSPAQQGVPPGPAPQQTEPPAPEAPAAAPENPGLFNEIGKLFEKSKSMLSPLKSPGEAIDDFNARAKDAGESLSNLARPSLMVTGRAACTVSSNGAPDCKTGADKLCQSKGYKEGKSLDTDAAEKCSPKVFIPGRKREPGDCRTENYVTRALCQ
jgi:hypothetical protein